MSWLKRFMRAFYFNLTKDVKDIFLGVGGMEIRRGNYKCCILLCNVVISSILQLRFFN